VVAGAVAAGDGGTLVVTVVDGAASTTVTLLDRCASKIAPSSTAAPTTTLARSQRARSVIALDVRRDRPAVTPRVCDPGPNQHPVYGPCGANVQVPTRQGHAAHERIAILLPAVSGEAGEGRSASSAGAHGRRDSTLTIRPMASVMRGIRSELTRPGPVRVSEVTVLFWVIKGLSTAMGESTSDYLVHAMAPELAVVFGFSGFVLALALQFRAGQYVPRTYWFTVVMVGIFGTMAADVLHVGLGVPYTASTVLYAAVLATVFILWSKTEGTLSVHAVNTSRREAFYWAAVVATFALGTALGDFTAYTLNLGYFTSAIVFAAVISIPAIGFRWFRWNAVFSFWFAYVITRPLGASIADGLGKSKADGGLGLGAGWVALGFGALIVALVAYLEVANDRIAPTPARPAH